MMWIAAARRRTPPTPARSPAPSRAATTTSPIRRRQTASPRSRRTQVAARISSGSSPAPPRSRFDCPPGVTRQLHAGRRLSRRQQRQHGAAHRSSGRSSASRRRGCEPRRPRIAATATPRSVSARSRSPTNGTRTGSPGRSSSTAMTNRGRRRHCCSTPTRYTSAAECAQATASILDDYGERVDFRLDPTVTSDPISDGFLLPLTLPGHEHVTERHRRWCNGAAWSRSATDAAPDRRRRRRST